MNGAARTALVSGTISIVCALVLGAASLEGVNMGDSDTPLFFVMVAATLVALVAGGIGLRRRGERRFAAAGVVLTLPALAVLAFVGIFLLLMLTGEIELS